MLEIKPEWVGFEIQFSHSYPDDSKWGMTYETYEVDHVDTGHSEKVVKIDCDGIQSQLTALKAENAELKQRCEGCLNLSLHDIEAERDKLYEALTDAMDLIGRAAPLAWLFHEPDGGEYHKTAGEWEKDAEELIARAALEGKHG